MDAMSVRDPRGWSDEPKRDNRAGRGPLADLTDRLAEARRAGDPVPEELERLVSLLTQSDYEPGERLTQALEGLARWSGAEESVVARRPAPAARRQPVPAELEARLVDFATSFSDRPKAAAAPRRADPRTPPIASLRAALAEISERQRTLDAEDAFETRRAPVRQPEPKREPYRAQEPSRPVAPARRPEPVRQPEPLRQPAAARQPDIEPRRTYEPQKPDVATAAMVRELRDEIDNIGRAVSDLPSRQKADATSATMVRELRAEIDRLGRSVSDLPTRQEVDSLTRELGQLAGRISTDRPARLDPTSLGAIDALVGEVDRMRRDAASPQMIADLAEELHTISTRLDVLGPVNSSAIDAVARRVEEVRSELSQFPRASAVDVLASEIQTLIGRLDQQERDVTPTRQAVVGLSTRVEALDGKIANMAEAVLARDDAFVRANSAIRAELDSLPRAEAVSDLGRQIDALTESLKNRSAIGPALKAVEGLSGRVEALDGKIETFSKLRFEEAERLVETMRGENRAAIGPALDAVEGLSVRVEALDGKIDAFSKVRSGEAEWFAEAMRDEIAAAARPDAFENLERQIASLATKMSGQREDRGVERFKALTGKIDNLGDRLTSVAEAAAKRSEAFDRIEDSVKVIAEQLLSPRASEPALVRQDGSVLETEVTRLVDGLERNDGRLDDLNAAFAGLAARIERSCADLGSRYEKAAATPAGHGGDARLEDEIVKALSDLRSSAAQSERRAADALDAVRATLERLLDRMEQIESTPQQAGSIFSAADLLRDEFETETAPAPRVDAAEAARAAARRALAEIASGDEPPAPRHRVDEPRFGSLVDLEDDLIEPGSGAPRVEPAPSSNTASFIAAARRASAQPSAETEPVIAVPADVHSAKAPLGLSGAISKLKARKRPFLLGLAATLIVFAALYVANGMTTGDGSDQSAPAAQSRLAPESSPKDMGGLPASAYLDPRSHAEAEEQADSLAASPKEQGPPPTAALSPADGPDAPAAEPRAAKRDGSPFAFADAASVPKARSVEWKAGEPVTTGSIAKVGPDGLPDAIGGPTLRMRAAAGDPSAQLEIADRLLEGRNVEPDAAAAAIWLEKAAAQGLAPAQHRLGSLYEKGRGVAKDVSVARRWYEQAAASGNVRAMHNLGVVHAEGGLGKPDYAAAVVWFRMAAERGLVDSQYNLAVLEARGLGGKRNLVEAYKWFSLAATQGDDDAAKKRDEVGKTLGNQLAAAKASVESFRARPVEAAANEVPSPAGGWDRVTERKDASTPR